MISDEKRPNEKPHIVTLDNRNRLAVSGVTDVECFDESEIVLHTTMGVLVVDGKDIRLEKLNTDSGDVTVLGTVASLVYEEKKARTGLIKRLSGR